MNKNKPYFQIYKKEGKIGHVRYKYVDENGKEHIRGLSATSPVLGKTIYEKGAKDSKGIDVNNKEYIAGDKHYLNDEQSKSIKAKIKDQDIIENTIKEKGTRIETQRNINLSKSHDREDSSKNIYYKKLDIPEEKLDSEWDKMNKTAEKVEYGNIRYHNPIIGVEDIQNSNSVIRTVLEENNHDYKQAVPKQIKDKVPGYETNLFDKPRFSKEEEMDKYVFPNSKAADKYHEQRRYKENMDKHQREIREISKNKNKKDVSHLNEDEVRELMKSDAYNNKYHPEYEKTQNQVRQSYEKLYPDDDRNKNPDNYYVWKTSGDSRVRSEHADLDGEVFCWDNPPIGGHPGEDYNCRCEAEPYVPPQP